MPGGGRPVMKTPERVSVGRKTSVVDEIVKGAELSSVIRSDVSGWLQRPSELHRP